MEGYLETAFAEVAKAEERSRAVRLVMIIAQWVVIGQRFGIRKAEKEDYE